MKDSVTNVRATGGRVTPVPSHLVKPPRVGESPAALECKVMQSIDLLDFEGCPTRRWFTIGQVVGVHIDERYLKDGLFDAVAARTISRCGYRDYAEVVEMFSMLPPQLATAQAL